MVIKICKALCLMSLLIFNNACAGREKVIYQDVFIPQKCMVNTPSRPFDQGSPMVNNLLIIEYALKLEAALEACKGGDL